MDFFTSERIIRLIVSAAIVAAAIIVLAVIGRSYRRIKRLRKETGQHLGRQGTITSIGFSIAKIVVVLLVILIVLEINGVRVTSLIAGLGIAGAIVGLALQDLLKDILMGMQITWDGFFEIGDVVRYGSFEGVVVDFNLRTTRLRSIDDDSVLSVSNRNISEITKLSDQVFLYIPLSYEESLKLSQELLEEGCRKAAAIEGITECRNLGLNNLNDSSVEWKIRVCCPPARKPDLRRRALRCIYEHITDAGVKVPFNQLDVHVERNAD